VEGVDPFLESSTGGWVARFWFWSLKNPNPPPKVPPPDLEGPRGSQARREEKEETRGSK